MSVHLSQGPQNCYIVHFVASVSVFQDPTAKVFVTVMFWWAQRVVIPPKTKPLPAADLWKGYEQIYHNLLKKHTGPIASRVKWVMLWGMIEVCLLNLLKSTPVEGSQFDQLEWIPRQPGPETYSFFHCLCPTCTGCLGITEEHDLVPAFMELAS